MGNVDHRRPLFKVMDAGGGQRIRTIAEDLRDAQVPAPVPAPRPRCGLCGSRQQVDGQLEPRCPSCRAHERELRTARRAAARSERAPRTARPSVCPTCHTELPVTGACGFCD